MERPSHINSRISHPLSSRLTSFGLAALLPAAILWGLANPAINKAIREFGPLHVDPIVKEAKTVPPPPPLVLTRVTPPIAVPPLFQITPQQQAGNQGGIQVTPLVTPPPAQPAQSVMPYRAAIGIMPTHTIPPYPVLALRMGEQGKVTLRLAVLADGHVGTADIVASSGSKRLDDAAREWVVAHWLYKPALDKGQPAPSQTLATVIFNLADQR